MNREEVTELLYEAKDKEYWQFLLDNGEHYRTEADIQKAYNRLTKSKKGILLTLDEFLEELHFGDDSKLAKQLYKTLVELVEKGAINPYRLYQYVKSRWCLKHPEAVISYRIGSERWAVNNCDKLMPDEQAILLINKDWGFEASRIELRDKPYYEFGDWNFISFQCGWGQWLLYNGELHQMFS